MQINLTFLVQLINFGITYWFLNRFMFKPVLEHISKKRKKEETTVKDLQKKEAFLVNLENKKQEKLIDFKVEMKTQYQLKPFKAPSIPGTILCKLDEQEAEEITETVTKMLTKRVPHVD